MSAFSFSEDRLLTEREVASHLGVSLAACRRWRVERRGPPFTKVSTLVRYSSRELEAWIAAQPKGGQPLKGRAA
jgi:predicted DNA-binding transcriptional regulator AlpA